MKKIVYTVMTLISVSDYAEWLDWMRDTHLTTILTSKNVASGKLLNVPDASDVWPGADMGTKRLTLMELKFESMDKFNAYKEELGKLLRSQHDNQMVLMGWKPEVRRIVAEVLVKRTVPVGAL